MPTVLLSVLVVAVQALLPAQAPIGDEFHAVHAFETRVAAYVDVHRRLEGPLPALEVSEDLGDVRAAMHALARAIQAARRDARQGDLFQPAVARLFRTRIAACLPPEQMAAVLAEHDEHAPRTATRLRVNAAWPDEVPFHFVPPQLLAVLPALPPELQYRVIGRALVLWDHHANLVVDFLPGAFTS